MPAVKLDPSVLVMGFAIVAGYFFLLSVFIGEEVSGGVEGGTARDTHIEGRTIVTEVEGGREVTYSADLARAADVRWLAIVAAAVAVLALLVMLVRREIRRQVDWSEIPGGLFGGMLAGVFAAFVTGMPIAKAVPEDVQWFVIGPLYGLGVATVLVVAFIAAGA